MSHTNDIVTYICAMVKTPCNYAYGHGSLNSNHNSGYSGSVLPSGHPSPVKGYEEFCLYIVYLLIQEDMLA